MLGIPLNSRTRIENRRDLDPFHKEHSPLSERPCYPMIMNEERDQRTEKILDLTLEIIHLLTGEDLKVVKKLVEHNNEPNASAGHYRLITEPSPHLPVLEKKILELTHRILRLLTGEVPIRCEDVTVHLSMEEWEYVEEHKELYKDLMMEDQHSLSSLDNKPTSGTLVTESENESIHRGQCLKSSPAEKWRPECITHESIISVPNPAQNHSERDLYRDCTSPGYAGTRVKENSASCHGENLPSSVLYVHQEHSRTEPPPAHIKEELAVCEVIITETHSLNALGSTPTEDPSNGSDPDCYRDPGSTAPVESDVDGFIEALRSRGVPDDCLVKLQEEKNRRDLNPLHKEHSPLSERPCNPVIMNEERDQRTEKILDLTLDIIYLLTGEHHVVVKRPGESGQQSNCPYTSNGCYSPITEPYFNSQALKKNILELTHRILRLLTGEVPIRCEDVTIHLSMEEWEYVERHKELYEDVMVENNPASSLKHKPTPGTFLNPVIMSDFGAENESIIKTINDVKYLMTNQAKKSHPESVTCESHKSGTCTAGNHSEWDSFTLKDCASIDFSGTCVKEELASYPGGDPSNSVLHIHSESPSIHIKEESAICEVIITDDLTHGDPDASLKEDTYDDRSDCYSTSLEGNSDMFSIDTWNLENNINSKPCKSPQSTQDPEAKSDYSQCLTSCNNAAESDLGISSIGDSELLVDRKNCSQKKRFQCSECGKCFNLKYNFLVHQRVHTGEKPFKCSECGNCFRLKHTLISHQRTHTGEKPFKCSECGQCFTQSSSLVSHTMTHTGEKPFKCPECGNGFIRKDHLAVHLRIHRAERSFKCRECGKCFQTKQLLIKHQGIHTSEKPFKCPECGKGFMRSSYLASHMRIHRGEKSFFCSECGLRFQHKHGLMSHQTIHTGEKPFKCPECGICFRLKHFLISHQRIHTGEKPFTCNECGKCFKVKYALSIHQKTHSGETPFKCDQCGKSFKFRSSLVKHKRTHR